MKTLRDIRDEIYAKAKENPDIKFYSLHDQDMQGRYHEGGVEDSIL